MRSLGALAVVLSVTQTAAFGQCIQGNGRQASVGSVQLVLQGFSSTTAVQQGINMWNASSCNEGTDDFPYVQLTAGAAATLTVKYEPGFNPSNDRSCGSMNHSTQTITLYGSVRDPGGFQRNCGLDGIVADNLAHELGHYFGLADSGCQGYIMFGVQFQNNGIYTDRTVKSDECDFADDTNSTQAESDTENPNDPWCDAYCWTNCVNNVCPDGNPWCPILIDTENDGFRLTGLEDPVWFDTNRDGLKERVSWTDGGEGFLALDRNENGTIDDAGELFGNQTPMAGGKLAENGYLVLAEHDLRILGGNANGEIDPGDWVYRYLLVWTDLNHNGTSEPWELQRLTGAGITRISLDYHESGRTDAHGNEFRFMSRAWKLNSNGTERPTLTWDVFFLLDP